MANCGRRIAIVGGGYAGLAVAFTMKDIAATIHVYDSKSVGNADASCVSAGILHSFTTRGGIMHLGDEGLRESLKLLKYFPEVFKEKITFRILFNNKSLEDWSKSAAKYPNQIQHMGDCHFPHIIKLNGVIRVDSVSYLQSLWNAVLTSTSDSKWISAKVQNLRSPSLLESYDSIILANGAGLPGLLKRSDDSVDLEKCTRLNQLRLVTSQTTVYEQRILSNGNKIDCDMTPIYMGGDYVVPLHYDCISRKRFWLFGSAHQHITSDQFEEYGDRNYSDSNAANLYLENGMLHKLSSAEGGNLLLNPNMWEGNTCEWSVPTFVSAHAGTRVITNRDNMGRLPVLGRLPLKSNKKSNVWVISGFGSRGLLYHGLMSKYLSDALINDDESTIPSCLSL